MNAIDILSKYWGYSTFRSKQEEVIENILVNKDVLAIFPVGEGKILMLSNSSINEKWRMLGHITINLTNDRSVKIFIIKRNKINSNK